MRAKVSRRPPRVSAEELEETIRQVLEEDGWVRQDSGKSKKQESKGGKDE